MKVPQTFTITIEQAGFLAQMKSGRRSSWIRAAIDNYRSGPIPNYRLLRRWVHCANLFQAYIAELGEEHWEAINDMQMVSFNSNAPFEGDSDFDDEVRDR